MRFRHKSLCKGAFLKVAVSLVLSVLLLFCSQSHVVYADSGNATIVQVNSYVNLRSVPSTAGSVVTTLPLGTRVTVTEETSAREDDTSGCSVWYKLTSVKSGTSFEGYVASKYIRLDATAEPSSDIEFEESINLFPESYRPYLRVLHEKYPDWVFYADLVEYEWDTILDKETINGVSLIQNTVDPSWQSKTNTQIIDSPNWVNASREIVAYYMDPRNMMTESSVFQFVDLNYTDDSLDASAIGKVLNNSFMAAPVTALYNSEEPMLYQDIFATAGNEASADERGINPVFLAVHSIQECGYRGSASSNGATGYYNFYNIGAYSDAVNASRHGLTLAQHGLDDAFNQLYNIPWNTPGLSIVNGGKWIYNNYVSKGQGTLYYIRFNVAPDSSYALCKHQYMTATQSVNAEGQRMFEAYKSSGLLDSELHFYIPVYMNMPAEASPIPTTPEFEEWVFDNGVWYHLNTNMEKDTGWQLIDDCWYYFSATGEMQTDWLFIDGIWYHFSAVGKMNIGWNLIDGKWYYFTDSGKLQTGWMLFDGNWYYFSAAGSMATGWSCLDGQWYYFSNNGVMKTGWAEISDKWYYFSNKGIYQTGWQQIGGKWYLFNSNGEMQTGWRLQDGRWYYFTANGSMAVGWQVIDGRWYYFSDGGSMRIGWQRIADKWYYFSSSGAMRTGWQYIDDNWYYFSAGGSMNTGWNQIGGKWYYFSRTGVMQIGWQEINGSQYYFDANGKMYTGSQIIDNVSYEFASNGELITE